MIICMSNLILIDFAAPSLLGAAAAVLALPALAGCGSAPAAGSESAAAAAVASPVQETLEPGRTGAPAQPLADAGDVVATSRIISKEELAQKFPGNGAKVGCFITFAYAGEPPETLIWGDEPCTALTTLFMTPADLKRSNDWDRLDVTDQQKVMALPEQRVLYVGGEFTASIYPLDTNNLTFEIVVSD
jgi:hypothetical protein